ncbi:MAG: proton-conducting transporter membrane subunit [Candidatus Omnitrophota bacterium]|nr:proton-conducting transporter membrane subunit [Candidatus Omnitrophota bacterium]
MQINLLYPWFRIDRLNGFIALSIILFSILTAIYSFRFMRGKPQLIQYYSCILLTALASLFAVLSNNLILLVIFWGFLGLTLYLLINLGQKGCDLAAKKTLVIVGGSDILMLLGIAIIYFLTGTFQMDKISISLSLSYNIVANLAYLCLAIACFAKAGAMPFHSWIPDCSEFAPIPVVAYLPASLDKLLGIYLLARISLDLFVMNTAMNIFLMAIGAFTIIAAVMMALVQHNLKRLLGYHAVSQVGYMVLGIGTGNPIGIAGGIFHMLNNSIYKQALFLTGGNIEYKTGTSDLDKLGGLTKAMPVTYISFLIASLAISGVPPFNGFVSKWMIYQGLIKAYQVSNITSTSLWSIIYQVFILLALVGAMFGSGLTLASFMKLLHAAFLGERRETDSQDYKEVNWQMWLPPAFLAILCLVLGIFAYEIPLRLFILPSVKGVEFLGFWSPSWTTLLIFVGLLIGLIIYWLGSLKSRARYDSYFVGGEIMPIDSRVTGTQFYNTVMDFKLIKFIYEKAKQKTFDIYEQSKNLVFSIDKFLQYLHNGILPTYLVWILLGTIGLFLILIR